MTAAHRVLTALARLPSADLDEILAPGPALVLAPHPDDESLGCGGLIAECAARGREVHVAILTDGGMSHPGSAAWPPRRLAMQRGAEVREATMSLGLPAARLHLLGEPDGDAPHDGPRFAAALARVEDLIRSSEVTTILASWVADPHGDHGSAHKLAAAAAQTLGIRHLAYPVWSWMLGDDDEIAEACIPRGPGPGAIRGARLDIGAHLSAKRRAIAAHRSQGGELIHDDPRGFVLPAAFLAMFDRPWEVYLRVGPEQP